MDFLKRNYIVFIGVFIGAIAGYFCWMKFSFLKINHPVTSGSFTSIVCGAVIGGLLSNMVKMKVSK